MDSFGFLAFFKWNMIFLILSNDIWHVWLILFFKIFSRKETLDKHLETQHAYKCLNCGFTAKTNEKLQRHIRAKHMKKEKTKAPQDGVGFYCDVCGERLANAFRLQQHMQIHDETRWPCKECNKVYNRQYNLYIHKKQVHSGKTFLCQICARPFTCQRNLRSHIQIVHTSDADKPYKCSMCTKGYV